MKSFSDFAGAKQFQLPQSGGPGAWLGMEPDSAGAKRWEGGVEKTWEEIGERADGTINYDDLQQQQRKRQRRYGDILCSNSNFSMDGASEHPTTCRLG